jgi:hypothetical protein
MIFCVLTDHDSLLAAVDAEGCLATAAEEAFDNVDEEDIEEIEVNESRFNDADLTSLAAVAFDADLLLLLLFDQQSSCERVSEYGVKKS